MRQVGQFLDKFVAYLAYVSVGMGVVSLTLMMLMITLNVVLRYLFNKPFIFVEEVSAYLVMIIVYMGFAYVTMREGHINVELVVRRLPERARAWLDLVNSLVALGLIGVYFLYAWRLFAESVRLHYKAGTVLATPLWMPQAILWVGLICFGLAVAARIVKKSIYIKEGFKKEAVEELSTTGYE